MILLVGQCGGPGLGFVPKASHLVTVSSNGTNSLNTTEGDGIFLRNHVSYATWTPVLFISEALSLQILNQNHPLHPQEKVPHPHVALCLVTYK